MSLGPQDQARLNRILKVARELEITWPQSERWHIRDLSANGLYQELRGLVLSCSEAEAESLRRLAGMGTRFRDSASLSHFYGCIVPFERLAQKTWRDDEFLVEEGDAHAKARSQVPLKLIVENVRSAFNVGAMFRTAECLGVSEIVLSGYTPGPDDEKTARTAMGAASEVPWRRVDRAPQACEELRREGYRIIALETAANASSLHEVRFDGEPTAFVLGNERFGIDAETLQNADAICRIPVRGIKNSMNVGIAFGICAFEWLRQFEERKK